jgi:hypothetical protein
MKRIVKVKKLDSRPRSGRGQACTGMTHNVMPGLTGHPEECGCPAEAEKTGFPRARE